MTVSNEGDWIISSTNELLWLLNAKPSIPLVWKYKYMPDDFYVSVCHRSIYDGLEFIFDGWRFDVRRKYFEISKMKKHYVDLNDKYGFVCRPTKRSIKGRGYSFLNNDKILIAIDLFKYYAELYSEDWEAYKCLGEAYFKRGDLELSRENYIRSVELNPNNVNGVNMLKKLKGKMQKKSEGVNK